MANFHDPKMLLGFLALVAIGMLGTNWSVQRALAFAAVWCAAAAVLYVRHRRTGRRETAVSAETGPTETAARADDASDR